MDSSSSYSLAGQIITSAIQFSSILVNVVITIYVFLFKRSVKQQDVSIADQKLETKKVKDELTEKLEKFSKEVHESFQKMSQERKEDRDFWKDFFCKIELELSSLRKQSSQNAKLVAVLNQKLSSELQRLDDKQEEQERLCNARMDNLNKQ